MTAFPLVHISWALADNAMRPACDAFFKDVFGGQTASEILITPETEDMGLDREESLMMIGDTMVIPIAPAGRGAQAGSPLGDMLRRSADPMRWIGLALYTQDLKASDAWFAERGFKRHYDLGMESYYFLVPRGQALGVRLEIVRQPMPGDPRREASWQPTWARDEHPLGIEGLQAIGVSTPTVKEARDVFAGKLEWPELHVPNFVSVEMPDVTCAAFAMGDTVIEALEGEEGSAIAKHAQDIKGIYHLVFKVRDAGAAAEWLREKGLRLIGKTEGRFAIHPDDAHGRLIWLTEQTPEGYPAFGSQLGAALAAE